MRPLEIDADDDMHGVVPAIGGDGMVRGAVDRERVFGRRRGNAVLAASERRS